MSSQVVTTFRYPTGDTEYEMGGESLKVGDMLVRNGERWMVVEVWEAGDGSAVVTLRAEESKQ